MVVVFVESTQRLQKLADFSLNAKKNRKKPQTFAKLFFF